MLNRKLDKVLGERRWSWWGQRAHDALGLNYLLNFDFLVCCDWGSDINDIWGEKVISLEKIKGYRKNFSNEDLSQFMRGETAGRLLKKLDRGSNCIMYRSIKELEKIALNNHNIKIFSPPLHLKDVFDDKIFFTKIVKKLALNSIPGEIVILRDLMYSDLRKKWGENFVIRYPVGSSGKRIHFITDKDGYEEIRREYFRDAVIVEKYLDGYSLNINMVVGKSNIYISRPSVQIAGISCLIDNIFGFAGNDFTSLQMVEDGIIKKVFDATLKVAILMKKYGFIGMAGMDFIISNGEVYPVEINPRFQNSTSLLTLLEIENDFLPLVVAHLREYDNSIAPDMGDYSSEKLNGSQIILHNLENGQVKVKNSLKCGIYEFVKNKLIFKRNGYSVMDIIKPDEFAIVGGVPVEGALLDAGAPLVKLHFRSRLLNDDLKTLKNKIELIVKKVYNKLIGENF